MIAGSVVPVARRTVKLDVTVEVGGIPILLRTESAIFRDLLLQRYEGFVSPGATPTYEFEIALVEPAKALDQDAEVTRSGRQWHIDRGDFHAELDPVLRRGFVRQAANPYAIDTVLRITHSLVLAEEGGFLLHAASAIHRCSAFVFAGVSGAGKTTISRLAPQGTAVLSDEISYVRRFHSEYRAYGTPFAGELARVGENSFARLKTLFLLKQGRAHRIDAVSRQEAVRALFRHILFFAKDEDAVQRVFDAALHFVTHVPVAQLTFLPNPMVWELIQ